MKISEIKRPGIEFVEQFVFLLVVVLNLIPVFQNTFFSTLDGPAHLYNSQLITSLFGEGNDKVAEFFSLRREIIPNWTGHFILTLFHFFLPAFLAEKILLLFYLIGLPYSFRALIKSLRRSGVPYLSYFIFPFTYSFVFFLGFYNFSIAIIFLFLSLDYWISQDGKKINTNKMVIMFLLLLFTYLSHIFVFVIAIFFLFCFSFYQGIVLAIQLPLIKRREVISEYFFKLMRLGLLAAIPVGMMFYYFYSRPVDSQATYLDPYTLISWLKNLRPIIVFNFSDEEKFTKKIVFVLVVIFVVSIYNRINLFFKNKSVQSGFSLSSVKNNIKPDDFWLFCPLVMLLLYFRIPDSSFSAGYLSVRLCYLFFVFLLIWLAIQPLRSWLLIGGVFVVLYCNFKLNNYYMRATKPFNLMAHEFYNAGKFVKPNSIVLPLNYSEEWFIGHFSNYLGTEKPMVILENYEAGSIHFPVKWKENSFPVAQQGNLNMEEVLCDLWHGNPLNAPFSIDYICITGKLPMPINTCNSKLVKILVHRYDLIYTSTNCHLYQKKSYANRDENL